jgi:hypothetical protein
MSTIRKGLTAKTNELVESVLKLEGSREPSDKLTAPLHAATELGRFLAAQVTAVNRSRDPIDALGIGDAWEQLDALTRVLMGEGGNSGRQLVGNVVSAFDEAVREGGSNALLAQHSNKLREHRETMNQDDE